MAIQKQQEYDPFNRPIPGSSLTSNGDAGFESSPPKHVDPDKVLDEAMTNLKKPGNMEKIMDLLFSGVSIEMIVNTWATTAVTKGDITPDVAELVKPTLALILLDEALERDIPVLMFDTDEAGKPFKDNTQALSVMGDARPELFDELLQKVNGKTSSNSDNEYQEDKQELGFISRG